MTDNQRAALLAPKQFWQYTNGGEAQAADQRLRELIRELDAERESILNESTQRRLQRVDQQLAAAARNLLETERAVSKAVKEVAASPEEKELGERLRLNVEQEQTTRGKYRGFPARSHIRKNALQDVESEIKSLTKQEEKIWADCAQNKTRPSPAGRLQRQLSEIGARLRWLENDGRKQASDEERLWLLYEDRDRIEADLAAIREQAREAALVGG